MALVGGFAPRKCGIATFTTDIFEQLQAHRPRIATAVWAVEDPAGPRADQRVHGRIASNDPAAWRVAAREINEGGFDAIWLQHEYGIFGGDCGEMVLDFAERLAVPLVVTCHTVLGEPSDKQRAILDRLVSLASQIMVMSAHARALLIECYGADPARVRFIAHGAPDRPFGRQEGFKACLGIAGRPVLMTFGLLGPGKGIEATIAALPAIVSRHPDVLYRIVGATHPNLVAAHGETYRERLGALATELGVADNVVFDNRFLETADLLDQLEACDVYVTPYPNLQQSTSGTLSYAVALGKAVVSTPYVHARELLGEGAGVLVAPGSVDALAEAVLGLLDDPAALAAMQRAAYERGRITTWPHFAAAAATLVEKAVARPVLAAPPPTATPGMTAIMALSDGTGMLQHGIGIIPDRRHGYCLDDNVRALLLMLRADAIPEAERERLASTYASFVQHAWNEDAGAFRNFMAFDRSWCEDAGSADSNGRTAWVLGEVLASDLSPAWKTWAAPWFSRAIAAVADIEHPRAMAFAMLGAAAALRNGVEHDEARALLERGGTMLHTLLDAVRRPDWAWFEAVLAYDNPRLPQALLEAGVVLDRADWRDEALDSLAWIAGQQCAPSGHFRPIGSEGFGREYTALPFDQQPLEAWAAIEAAASAFAVTREARWLEHAEIAHRWYFGGNDRGVVLGDLASGRCRDGVTPQGANENCGAESVLAFQLACYAMAGLARAADRSEAGNRLGPTTRVAADPAPYPR
ncbi:MAG: glycosyltransferase family 4 protein [Novosphingobium sp.]|nr:glycosyltransferase family 4 protein [Novosphingobium sp.]